MWQCLASLVMVACLLGSAAISAEMQTVLDKHNVYRCLHDVPPLIWDDDIAANAQAWASTGEYKLSSPSARVINGTQADENIGVGYPALTGVGAARKWYHQIKETSPLGTLSMVVPFDVRLPYARIVWKASTRLGCGRGSVSHNGRDGDFWVCQYSPAGNYEQLQVNVLVPENSLATCGGTSADVPLGHPERPGLSTTTAAVTRTPSAVGSVDSDSSTRAASASSANMWKASDTIRSAIITMAMVASRT